MYPVKLGKIVQDDFKQIKGRWFTENTYVQWSHTQSFLSDCFQPLPLGTFQFSICESCPNKKKIIFKINGSSSLFDRLFFSS